MDEEPIPAATLILVRERHEGAPELLMVERAGHMAFAAGAWVFPGGRIDDADRELAGQTGCDTAVIAAIRETLEETAVPVAISPVPDQRGAHTLQDGLAVGGGFADLLRERGLELEPSVLTPFARWVPQFHAVRRFDTMFFIAPCPAGEWQPRIVEAECAAAAWLSAAELLERERRGEARLIFPTRRNLERLAQHGSFKEMREDALAHPIEAVTPWIEERNGAQFITIPDHLGYPVTQERLEGLWRG